MLKQKSSIKKWANEIYRCESVFEDENSTQLEQEQAQWKIEAIMSMFENDQDSLMTLVLEIERLLFETLDK